MLRILTGLNRIPLHLIAWAELAAIFSATSSLPPFVRNAVVHRYRADGLSHPALEKCPTIHPMA